MGEVRHLFSVAGGEHRRNLEFARSWPGSFVVHAHVKNESCSEECEEVPTDG